MLTGGRFIYASALRLAVLKFILSMTVRAPALSVVTSHHVQKTCCHLPARATLMPKLTQYNCSQHIVQAIRGMLGAVYAPDRAIYMTEQEATLRVCWHSQSVRFE